MGQILVRQLDDATIEKLKTLARERKTSVEALARDAITGIAGRPTVAEKMEIVRQLQAWSERTKVPGVKQTPGVELIREDRDR